MRTESGAKESIGILEPGSLDADGSHYGAARPVSGSRVSGAEQHANGRRDRRSWTWAALLRRALNSQRPAAGCGGPHRLVEGDRFGCTERSRCRSSGAGFVAKPDARASTNVRWEGLGSFRRARLPRKPTSRIVVRLRARPPPPLSTSGFRLTRTASQTKVRRHSAHTQFRTRFLEPESTRAITRREPVKRLRREKGRAHHALFFPLGRSPVRSPALSPLTKGVYVRPAWHKRGPSGVSLAGYSAAPSWKAEPRLGQCSGMSLDACGPRPPESGRGPGP